MATDYQTELAPVADWREGAPNLHAPKVYGAGRSVPFLYAIPTTGKRPLTYAIEGLPAGLTLAPATGFITGQVTTAGEYDILVRATNAHGTDEAEMRLVIGGSLALTPPMGWNSWNCWGGNVNADRIRAAANGMVESGLSARGYTYINIDSSWQGERHGPLNAIQANHKFPDIKGLVEQIHGLGLKAGIYSTPWTTAWGGNNLLGESAGASTGVECDIPAYVKQGRYVGEERYEENDSKQWAEWGIDYLKYDWRPCDPVSARRMRDALDATSRDFVFSITTEAKIEHADAWTELTHLWRRNGDTSDSWQSVCANGFFSTEIWEPHTGPGHWFDADMLVLGRLGWGEIRENRLTVDEQMTHMTLWALLASPLFLGCDLQALDDLTLRLVANEEVLAIDQDPLGKQGYCVREVRCGNGNGGARTHQRIYAKPLADGSTAVGLFNIADEPAEITLDFADLDLVGSHPVRNVWTKTDMGSASRELRTDIPAHGARLFLIR